MIKSNRKFLSLLLALSMLLSMAVIPASAAGTPVIAPSGVTLTLDKTLLSLAESKEDFTATLTVKATGDATKHTAAEWTSWAKNLDWFLTRTPEESVQDAKLYPNIYTGDKLENWTSWGTIKGSGADGKPYFTMGDTTAAVSGDGAVITLKFSHGVFFENTKVGNSLQAIGSSTFRYTRNVYGSMIGDYHFSVKDGGKELATTPMEINVYESYLRYDALYQELMEIKKLAQKNGRYCDVRSYGKTTDGRDQWYVILSDSEKSVTDFQAMNNTAITDPAAIQAKIKQGNFNYRVPVMINNVHPDEGPAPDAPVNLLRILATEKTVPYNTITGLKDGKKVDLGMYDPKLTELKVGKYAFTGYGLKVSGDPNDPNGNNGRTDASEFYTFSNDLALNVDEILKNIIVLVSPVENPDGRAYNTRPTANGFDLNRDCTNQTQPETTNMARLINQWNPVAFIEYHGFTAQFLVEPCTPPHEPNLEYDLLVDNFLLGAEAFGNAALATMSVQHKDEFETKFQTYYTPLRDNYDTTKGWDAWDDLNTNYTPSYAMLNAGSMGFTIETPSGNEAACRLLESGMYGLWQYITDNKAVIYQNQLEFFRRGVENIDARAKMDGWYVDQQNKTLAKETWRIPNKENNNYFPEYWVLPVDAADQRDPANVYEMAQFLIRNGVKISTLDKDTTVGGTVYKAGALVVDMYQAKRNYANCVLWSGCDASQSGFPDLYSESVSNFPEMRGFDCVKVTTKDAFKGVLTPLTAETVLTAGKSQFTGVKDKAVILANNGQETVRTVNELLSDGKAVGLVSAGAHKGDFVVNYADYQSVAGKHILVGTGVETMPLSYQIHQPSVYIAGRYAPFAKNTVTEGYYAKWFSNGYGYTEYQNIHNNGTYNYDRMAYDKQLGMKIVDDPAKADVIIGSVSLNSGAYGKEAVAAVKAGTPYIATGESSLEYVRDNLLPGNQVDTGKKNDDGDTIYTYNFFDYESLGLESLHYVTYPANSITTASYVGDADNILYSLDCSAITKVPQGAQVLIQGAASNSQISGCCLTADGKALDGRVEAIALNKDGMDLTIFSNSIVNRAHQQDDYRYVTNTIYSKTLSKTPMTISGTASVPVFTDVPANHWAVDDIYATAEQKFLSGTSATTFAPSAEMSRAMLITALHRMSGKAAAVAPGATWYDAAMVWGKDAGVTDGSNPQGNVTREQIAVLLYNYAKTQGSVTPLTDKELAGFKDTASVSKWATDGMAWAVGNHIIGGKSGEKLDPGSFATRAEVAAMVSRFAKI